MAQRLKRWESPRREGRNDKGRGGSARQRQRRKQFQMLRNKLKGANRSETDQSQSQQDNRKGEANASPFTLGISPILATPLQITTKNLAQRTCESMAVPALTPRRLKPPGVYHPQSTKPLHWVTD